MKILLDNIIYSNTRQGGISNYWFELSKFLLNNTSDEILFYEEPGANLNFHRRQLLIPQQQIISHPNLSKSSLLRRLGSVDIGIEDYFLFHSSYYRSKVKAKSFSQVTTVHDFTHNFYAPFLKKVAHNYLKYNAIRKSAGIICISESTYNDLKKFCPPNKNQKVAVIPNGVSEAYKVIDRSDKKFTDYINGLGIDSEYILYIGSRVNYKNFAFATQLMNELPTMKFVVVGEELSAREKTEFSANMLQRTTVVGNVSDEHLNILYNFAHAFIYPSAYEGFGIPIIEAMRSGCPVLALRNSSIVEVAGDAGILLESTDIGEFKNAISNLYNINYRNEVIERGLMHSAKYSWEKCCRETHEFYKTIYQSLS